MCQDSPLPPTCLHLPRHSLSTGASREAPVDKRAHQDTNSSYSRIARRQPTCQELMFQVCCSRHAKGKTKALQHNDNTEASHQSDKTKAPQQSDNRKQHHIKLKRQTHHSRAKIQKHDSMGDARRLKHEGCLRRCHAGVTPHSAPRAWRLARRGEAFGMCPLLQSTGSPLLKNSGRRCRRKTRRSKTVADQGGSGALNNPMARTRQNGRSA